jgi:hypothetical protein
MCPSTPPSTYFLLSNARRFYLSLGKLCAQLNGLETNQQTPCFFQGKYYTICYAVVFEPESVQLHLKGTSVYHCPAGKYSSLVKYMFRWEMTLTATLTLNLTPTRLELFFRHTKKYRFYSSSSHSFGRLFFRARLSLPRGHS